MGTEIMVTAGQNLSCLWIKPQGVNTHFIVEWRGQETPNYAGIALKKYLEYYSPIPINFDDFDKIRRKRISFKVPDDKELEMAMRLYSDIREYWLYQLKGFRAEFKSINAESPAEYIEKLKQVVIKYKTFQILRKL